MAGNKLQKESFARLQRSNQRMKWIAITLLTAQFCFVSLLSFAQKTNEAIKQGNDAYRNNDYVNAIKSYEKALQIDANNVTAKFNLANALQRANSADKAAGNYNDVISNTSDAALQAKAYYNRALAMLQDNKLDEAISDFKQSLRLSPNDRETRENLQKALETKKQQQPQQQPKQEKKPPQTPKQQKQQQMSRQMMEQKFKELEQQEKELQKEVQKQKTNNDNNEKDW